MIGLWGAVALVFSGMVGSGILILSSQMAQYGAWGIISWILSACMIYSIASVFGSLSVKYKDKGNVGPSDFIGYVFGENAAFILSLGYFFAMAFASAITAMTLAEYFLPIIGCSDVYVKLIAILSMVFLLSLNIVSFGAANSIVVFLNLAKLIFFLSISLLGARYFSNYSFTFGPVKNLFAGAATSMFAFLGIEFAILSSGSIKNPEKNVLLATKIGLFFATLVFIGVHCACLFVLPGLNQSCLTPVFDVSKILFGDMAAQAVSLVAVLSCVTTLNGSLIVQGGSLNKFSENGWLSKDLYESSKGFYWKGALVSVIVSSLTLLFKPVYDSALVVTVSLVGLLYLAVVLADIKLSGFQVYNFLALVSSVLILYNMNLQVISLLIIIYVLSYTIKLYFSEGAGK